MPFLLLCRRLAALVAVVAENSLWLGVAASTVMIADIPDAADLPG